MPLTAFLGVIVLLAFLGFTGALAWRSLNDSAPLQDVPTETVTRVPVERNPAPPAEHDHSETRQQAEEVDSLLSDMARTRSELGEVVSTGCSVEGMQSIRNQRQGQLSTAETLQVDALPNGDALKNALTKALRASVRSNNLYLNYAPGCPSDEAADDVNSRARTAKAEVTSYWNSIATEHGLSPRDSGNI